MKVIVFALTGLGNIVVEELLKQNVNILYLSTRKENGAYPYFDCPNIVELCKIHKIPTFKNKVSFDQNCDLLISATYHKKIIVNNCKFKLGVNMHPSYLPYLKGKDPIKNALDKNEQNLGVTTHKITNEYDMGEILFQKRINFGKNDTKKNIIKRLIPIYKQHIRMLITYYKKKYS